uniref:BED-type domain-containing protein n=1 Tax=Haptolina ericina TaxID=156174 RepID=A0A6T9CQT5_9EUKA|mmetsp:Transcript_23597/g.53676  ORF Transcript_23597/g.53676 Transcript_23597/m.53676 type:complete len:210 (+) Transcript_23597:44-673(+)
MPGVEPEAAGDDPRDVQRGVAGTGLAQADVAPGKKWKPSQTLPARMGPVWATVSVVGKEYETCPNLVCKDCEKSFSGGITRIEDHICKDCTCSTPELVALKAKITAERAAKAEAKQRKEQARAVQAAADGGGAKVESKAPVRRPLIRTVSAQRFRALLPFLAASSCAPLHSQHTPSTPRENPTPSAGHTRNREAITASQVMSEPRSDCP